MAVDYKKILIAYIDQVGMCEGVTFVDRLDGLTDEENDALLAADRESEELYRRAHQTGESIKDVLATISPTPSPFAGAIRKTNS